MLQWASVTEAVDLCSPQFTTPGWPEFLRPACNLTTLCISCHSALEAAQAEVLFTHCSKALRLWVTGTHVPSNLPLSLSSVAVFFSAMGQEHWDPEMPNILLLKLAHLAGLRNLSIWISTQVALLESPVILPQLDIKLGFTVCFGTSVKFGWLRLQPLSSLEVSVTLREAGTVVHRLAMGQLQVLPTTTLKLSVQAALSRKIQRLWQQLRPTSSCTVDMYAEAYASAAAALVALPTCPRITLRLQSRSSDAPPTFIKWPALTGQAARVEIVCPWLSAELHILGGCCVPDGELWQLTISSSITVQGLSGAVQRGDKLLLQNEAARLAGWNADDALQWVSSHWSHWL